MSTKKIVFEYLAGLVVSGLGFGFLTMLPRIPGLSWLEIYLGGDKAGVFTGLFLGVPIGGVLGIFLLGKVVFKAQDYNIMGIAVGLALSFIFGGLGTVLLISKLGGQALFIAPFLYVILALIGYTIPLHK
jgi:hypothetical protein